MNSEQIRSLRLTFRYDDDGLRLVGRTPRRSPPPPTEPLERDPPPGALVLEVRAGDEVRHRQFLVEAIPQSLEAGTPERGLRRVPYAKPSGAFSAVVPPPEKGAVVVVSAGPGLELAQPGLRAEGPPRWRELARARLAGDRDGD